MVEYQEHHLGGGGCSAFFKESRVAFKQGDFESRSPGSLGLPASGYVATGNHPFQVFGISSWVSLLVPRALFLCRGGQMGVPNRILDSRRNLNLFRQLGV